MLSSSQPPSRVGAALWLLFAAACSAPTTPARQSAAPLQQPPCTNAIAASALAPRFVQDQAQSAKYIAEFPKDAYQVFHVPTVGAFYLDDRDDVIKTPLRQGRVWEPHIRTLLRAHALPGSTVIDAGAHIGTHTLLLAQLVGPQGAVYAFEPQRKIHRELVHNLKLNQVTNAVPLRYALGDRDAAISMGSTPEGNEGHTAVGTGGDPVELRSLDSFEFCNVSLIKIDVEGYEDHVLRGALRLIKQQRPTILAELMGGHLLETATPEVRHRIGATVQTLARLGYSVRRVGAHDYLATAAADVTPCAHDGAEMCTRSMPVGKAPYRSSTGVVDASTGTATSTGQAGTLLFGPYEVLPRGSYVVRWQGTVARGGAARVDVVSGGGDRIHAELPLTLPETAGVGSIAVAAFTLSQVTQDLEYRFHVMSGVEVQLHRVEVKTLVASP